MKFVIFGAGAIGAYVGALLHRGGADVTFIARGPHLEALRARGVMIRSSTGDFQCKPFATDDVGVVREADVVFLGLKANSVPDIAVQLGALLRPDACVIAAQNGIPWWYFQSHGGGLDGISLESVDPGGIIANSIDPAAIVGCVVYVASEVIAPGIVRHVEGTRLSLGEPDRTISNRCVRIAEALNRSGLKAPIKTKLRDEVWLKLIGNATFNPVSALTAATLGQLGEFPDMRRMLMSVFEEIEEVAVKLGVRFGVSLGRRLEAGLAVDDHRTSMLQDLIAGRPLEYRCMTGAIIEIAGRLGLAVPRLETIHSCIGALDWVRQKSPGNGGVWSTQAV